MSRRRDSRANAARIVGALRQLWTEQSSPSLDEVAATAGVGIATLYRHFPNRAALEEAALATIFAEEIAPVVQRPEDDDTDILEVAEEFIEVIGHYAPLLHAIGISDAADEALRGAADGFLDILRTGQRAGALRADLEPVDLFWLLRMAVLGLTSPLSSPAVRRRYLALLLGGLSPGREATLPRLETSDYDRLGVAPDLRPDSHRVAQA